MAGVGPESGPGESRGMAGAGAVAVTRAVAGAWAVAQLLRKRGISLPKDPAIQLPRTDTQKKQIYTNMTCVQ